MVFTIRISNNALFRCIHYHGFSKSINVVFVFCTPLGMWALSERRKFCLEGENRFIDSKIDNEYLFCIWSDLHHLYFFFFFGSLKYNKHTNVCIYDLWHYFILFHIKYIKRDLLFTLCRFNMVELFDVLAMGDYIYFHDARFASLFWIWAFWFFFFFLADA